jgi:hypothetical protein
MKTSNFSGAQKHYCSEFGRNADVGYAPQGRYQLGASFQLEEEVRRFVADRGKTTTFLAVLRNDRIDAPWLIDGESFRTCVEKVLVPTLRPGTFPSLDLNPIEQVFAKLKHSLRKAAARSIETTYAAVGGILGAFTPGECADFYKTQAMHKPKCIML